MGAGARPAEARTGAVAARLAAGALLALGAAAAPGFAQQASLPGYAYDMVAEVSIATTADAKCAGLSARKKKVQARIVELYRRLAADGIATGDAVVLLQKPETLKEVARREAALRKRHGVAASGDKALCQAIRAEAAENKAVAAMLRTGR